MSELTISGAEIIARLESKIDSLSTKIIELKDELHVISGSQETRLAAVEASIARITESEKRGETSRQRIHERLEALERLPGEQALLRQQETAKTARMTTVRTVVTVLLSAIGVALVLFVEKLILGG